MPKIFGPSGSTALKTDTIQTLTLLHGLKITGIIACERSSLCHPQMQVKTQARKEGAIQEDNKKQSPFFSKEIRN